MKLWTALLLAALGLTTQACLLPEELDAERPYRTRASPIHPDERANGDDDTGFPIGVGDRFRDGAAVPQGLATNDRDLQSILNVDEVATGLKALANAFDTVKLFTAPHTTHENRTVHGAIIGGEPRVFIQSGIHARERGGPDHMLYFISDLLHAQKAGTGVKYGPQSYTKDQVVTALSAGIAIVPLINPDGVAYDQRSGRCWRKNRNRKSAIGEYGIGIDLNRNFDALWDYKRLFSLDASVSAAASDDPASEIFHGTAPFSEPETQNTAWVMQQHANLSWFLDLHSFGGDVLYSWGDDNPQSTDPKQNFLNKEYDGKRGFLGVDPPDSVYAEFLEERDLSAEESIAARMAETMSSVGNVTYRPKQSANLYPTSGSSTDYALSGYYGHRCNANRILGLVIEFGRDGGLACPFYPTDRQYHESMRQVATGLMEFLLNAAGKAGDLKTWKC